jgi:predicted enzyme related to lactoylglutathione lyase
MKRAKAFYESVFDVQFAKLDSPEIDMWAFPIDPGRSGASGAIVRIHAIRLAFPARAWLERRHDLMLPQG